MINRLNKIAFLITIIAGTFVPTENATSTLETKSLENIALVNPIYNNFPITKTQEVKKSPKIKNDYSSFKYQEEIPQILKHAEIVGVEPELLMAIRSAEGAKDYLAYGIKPGNKWYKIYHEEKGYFDNEKFYAYIDEKEKQLSWATHTIKNNIKRFNENSKEHPDFISYLANIYAPIGASNDPTGLNINWERNVRDYYSKFKN